MARVQAARRRRPAQIADAQANGFTLIAPIVEDGVQKVLLYKAVDQLRECLTPS
jgi:thymidylate synthase